MWPRANLVSACGTTFLRAFKSGTGLRTGRLPTTHGVSTWDMQHTVPAGSGGGGAPPLEGAASRTSRSRARRAGPQRPSDPSAVGQVAKPVVALPFRVGLNMRSGDPRPAT